MALPTEDWSNQQNNKGSFTIRHTDQQKEDSHGGSAPHKLIGNLLNQHQKIQSQ
jgi:hypothetical protein